MKSLSLSRFFEVLREPDTWRGRSRPGSFSIRLAKVDEVKSKDPRLKRFVASLEEVPVQDLNKILKALRLPKEYSELAVLAKTYEKKVPKVSSSSSEKLLFLKKQIRSEGLKDSNNCLTAMRQIFQKMSETIGNNLLTLSDN